VPVGQLFTAGRAVVTVLLWVGFYSIFGLLVTHTAWTPILLRGEGMDIGTIALTLAVFNFGSVIGSGSAGWLLDRMGTLRLVPMAFLLAGLSEAALGHAAPDTTMVVVVQAVLGLTAGCASTALIALAATSYPTAIRSTGVGWSMGMGRFGSFCGPLAVGVLVVAHWASTDTFVAIGASLLLGCAATLILGMRRR
jgi:AAHS family 4-hydroxybenzoate transporter-like MFS transporter